VLTASAHPGRLERRRPRHLHKLVKRPPERLSDGPGLADAGTRCALLSALHRVQRQTSPLSDVRWGQT
jgi:hypothetical protein